MAVAVLLPLLLGSLGFAPLRAAQRDLPAEPLTSVVAAEAEPTPEPTPTPTPEPTPWPTPAGLKGVDLSHWNGHPDFTKLQDKGVHFVISKATQGTSFVDDTYRRHTRDARAAGLLTGAYHFFDYNRSGIKQARHFLSTLRGTTGLGSHLPLVVDVETLKSLGTPDTAKARARLQDLLDELYRQTGRYPMIYTSRYMWQKVVGAPTSFGQYPLWVACWGCDTVHLPRGWSGWQFWQYGQAKFGSGHKLDANVYRSARAKLELEQERPMQLDRGSSWTSDRVIEADLRGFDGTQVRYGIDSDTFGPWLPYERRLDLKLKSRQGKQGVRLQLRSFRGVKSPVLRSNIQLDTVAPTVNGPKVKLRANARVPLGGKRVPTVVTMDARDATSGLKSAGLSVICDGKVRASSRGLAAGDGLSVELDRRGCTLRGSAKDAVGHRTTRKLSPRVGVYDIRRNTGRATFSGRWQIGNSKDAIGRSVARASERGATAKVRFEGTQFAVVAKRGPAGGRFRVIVDGREVGVVDLYASKPTTRRVVYVAKVPTGKHMVKLVATGTKRKNAAGTSVWLDAVVVLDRHK